MSAASQEKRRRGWRRNAALFAASLLVAWLGAEGLLRLVLEKADVLSPVLAADPVLHHRVASGSAGYDAWGFRNKEVPARAAVVAIGDSQTFGHGLRRRDAWPARLAELSGRTVYNLSLGGYGPVQYAHLLATRALALEPELIAVGLYPGNDLLGAYHAAYRLDFWRGLRRPPASSPAPSPAAAGGGIELRLFAARFWLSRHSMVYRLLARSPLRRPLRALEARSRDAAAGLERVELMGPAGRTSFQPAFYRRQLDLEDRRLREGLRITRLLLGRMAARTGEGGARLLVLMIPTKARVYAPWLRRAGLLDRHPDLSVAVAAEEQVFDDLERHLEELGVPALDATPALRRALEAGERIYDAGPDFHLAAPGQQVLAELVARRGFDPP